MAIALLIPLGITRRALSHRTRSHEDTAAPTITNYSAGPVDTTDTGTPAITNYAVSHT